MQSEPETAAAPTSWVLWDCVGADVHLLPRPLPAGVAVMGYDDGPESEWTAGDWQEFADVPQVHLSVLANPRPAAPPSEVKGYDLENGNAPAVEIAAACRANVDAGEAVVVYCSPANRGPDGLNLDEALATRGLRVANPAAWPDPGVYWGAAHWTGTAHLEPGSIFTQWTNGLDHDTSECYGTFPTLGHRPPPPEDITVQLHQLQEGNTGLDVAALQVLLNHHAAGLVVDGIFGPATAHAVRTYQEQHGLSADSIAGVHTFGLLLGVPQ